MYYFYYFPLGTEGRLTRLPVITVSLAVTVVLVHYALHYFRPIRTAPLRTSLWPTAGGSMNRCGYSGFATKVSNAVRCSRIDFALRAAVRDRFSLAGVFHRLIASLRPKCMPRDRFGRFVVVMNLDKDGI